MPARFAFLLLFLVSTARAGEVRRVTIRGAGRDLGETPMLIELNPMLPVGDYSLSGEGGPALPASVFEAGGKGRLAFVLPGLKRGETRRYTLSQDAQKDRKTDGVAFVPEGKGLRVEVDDQPLTTYHPDLGPKPILFPLIGPTRAAFTRAFPMEQVEGEDKDHPHQRSFWFTHGKVNGVDFWSELPGHGAIRETSRSALPGRLVGILRTTNDWVDPAGKTVCQDERTLRFRALKSAWLVDFDVTIKASNGPVTFGDTKEGMFGVRVASVLDANRKEGGKITNADGLTNADAWGKASPWVDYAGKIDGKAVGIAIMNHPDSFRYPTTWHVREYGLFAANPFGWKDFGRAESGEYTLPAGESITFLYRVVLHEGDTASANLPAAFEAYARPPKVEIQGE